MNSKFYNDPKWNHELHNDLQSIFAQDQVGVQFAHHDFPHFSSFMPDLPYDKNPYSMIYPSYKAHDFYHPNLYPTSEENSVPPKQPFWTEKSFDVGLQNKNEFFKDSYNRFSSSTTHRTRQTYSKEQTNLLENEFKKTKYLTKRRRKDLAVQTELSERQLKIWFQNRRMKWKKENNIDSLTGPDGEYYSI